MRLSLTNKAVNFSDVHMMPNSKTLISILHVYTQLSYPNSVSGCFITMSNETKVGTLLLHLELPKIKSKLECHYTIMTRENCIQTDHVNAGKIIDLHFEMSESITAPCKKMYHHK